MTGCRSQKKKKKKCNSSISKWIGCRTMRPVRPNRRRVPQVFPGSASISPLDRPNDWVSRTLDRSSRYLVQASYQSSHVARQPELSSPFFSNVSNSPCFPHFKGGKKKNQKNEKGKKHRSKSLTIQSLITKIVGWFFIFHLQLCKQYPPVIRVSD